MAFEQLYRFPDAIKEEVERLRREKSEINSWKETAIIDSLYIYFNTALQHAKFRSQRDHCRKIMYELNPAMAKGYFGK